MYSTSEFKRGLKIEYDNKPYVIVDFQHVNPGKGSAFVRTRLKNLETGQVLEITFKSGDTVPKPNLEQREMQFLYSDGSGFVFMDNATFEQFTLTAEDLGAAKNYLVENGVVTAIFFNHKPVSVEVENFVLLKVKETQPNIKGDTSGGGGKPAILETGLTITVPFHVAEGETVKVDTRTAKYVEKVK